MGRHYNMSRVELYKKIDDITGWDSTAIVLSNATKLNVKLGIGNVKDTFKFKVSSANDRLTRKFFSGNGSDKTFTMLFIPTSNFLGTDKFQVWVDDSIATYAASPSGNTQYKVIGTTLEFGAAPGVGTDNIEVRFEVITADDKAAIYIWQDKEWADMSDDEKNTSFKIEGTITQPALSSNDSGRYIDCSGVGMIESIFGALAFVRQDFVSAPKEWWELIIDTISQLNKYNPDRKIYGESQTEWTNMSNPITKNNGDSFAKIQYSASYKRAIEIIEELTQEKYTDDGQYIYYVKKIPVGDTGAGSYGFYCRYKEPDVSSGDTITQGTEPMSTKAKRATDEVINAVIYNCGLDPASHGMEYLNFEPSSQSSVGSKWKYVTSTNRIGENILNDEFQANPTKFDQNTDKSRKSDYPNDYDSDGNGYWEFSFKPRTSMEDPTYSTSAAKDVDSDAEWIDQTRLESFWRGHDQTSRIIKLYSNPRYKVTCTIYQSNNESIGSAYNVILPSFGLHTTYPLRLKEITHTFWDTDLSFEEDETTASSRAE